MATNVIGIVKQTKNLFGVITKGIVSNITGLSITGTGIMVKNGASSAIVRTLTGTSNEITVTNGDGQSGDPTVSLPSAITLTGKTVTGGTLTGSVKLGSTADANFTYYGMARQALINGNFDVWQRLTTINNPADGIYTSDRWRTYTSAASGTLPTTITHSRQTLTSGDLSGSIYSYRIAPNGAGSGYGAGAYGMIGQRIENGTLYLCGASKQITVSFWAKSSIANKKIGIGARQVYGTGGSPTAEELINGTNWTLTSTWTKYTYTFTTNTLVGKTFGSNNDDLFEIFIGVMWGTGTYATLFGSASVAETYVGSGNIDIAQVAVCSGDVALPFQPRSFNETLRLCQRYYEKSYAYATAPATNTASGYIQSACLATVGAAGRYNSVYYKVTKRTAATPTIYPYTTATNTGRVSDSSGVDLAANSGGVATSSEWGFSPYNNSGGSVTTNGMALFHFTVDAEI